MSPNPWAGRRLVGLRVTCGRCGREATVTTEGVTWTRSQVVRLTAAARLLGWTSLERVNGTLEAPPARSRCWACRRCGPVVRRRDIDPDRWRRGR